jgi:hypothetical protein
MSDSKKKIYLGSDLVCQTFTDAEEQAKAFDLFGLEQPIVSSNAPASTRPVQQGQVCEFDGVDDFILSSELIRPDLDVEIIFKVNSATGSSKAIFGGGAGSVRFYAQYNEYNGGTLHVIIGAYQSSSALNSVTGLPENVWHTLRMKSNGDWYLNGIFQANVGDAVTTTPSNTSDNKLNIGRRGDSTGSHSNISVASFKVIEDGDLSTQYNLNHASGTTAYDSSGNGNDGTLQNGAAFVVDNSLPPETDRLNLEGFNKRMLFDGVNDDVTMAGITNEPLYDIEVGFFTPVDITAATTAKALMNFDTSGSTFADIGFGNVTGSISNEVVTLFSTSYRIGVNNITIDAGYHTVRFKWDGVSTYLAYIDGILQTTTASGTPAVVNMPVFQVGGARAYYGLFSGVISNITLRDASGVVTSQWNGYGNTDADWIDQVGSNDGTVNGSPENLLIPRDESDPTNDIDGNPLQYSGSVYPRRPEYRNSYAASFDGLNDYVEIPAQVLSHNQAWSIEVDFKFLATPTYRTLYGEGNSATGTPQINLGILGTHTQLDLFWRSDNNTTILNEALFPVVSGNQYIVKVTFDGVDEVTVWKDGVITHTFTITPLVTTVDRATFGALGRSGVGSFSNAEFFHVKTTQGGSTVGEYTLTEGAGDTAHDISGNGNHGTINNASTGTEGAGFWAGRIDGEANALNNNNGFSKRMLFDGVNDEVELPDDAFNTQSSGYIEADVLCVGGGNYTVFGVASSNTSNQILSMQILTTNKIRIGYGGANFVEGTTVLTSGVRYRIKWESNGTEWKIYIDGVEETTTVTTGSNTGQWFDEITSGSTRYSVGLLPRSSGDSSIFKGTVYDLIINNGTADIASYNGYGNTDSDWTDQVGSNNGTVNGSPALLRIPADTSDPTKDVFGDTLTNPSITDGYNGAETELDAYNIAEGENPSPATNNNPDLDAIEFGTDFASNDAAFMRLKSSTENDRLITFADDLTGGDETLAQKYTQ